MLFRPIAIFLPACIYVLGRGSPWFPQVVSHHGQQAQCAVSHRFLALLPGKPHGTRQLTRLAAGGSFSPKWIEKTTTLCCTTLSDLSSPPEMNNRRITSAKMCSCEQTPAAP